jgi:hypothetical protein
VYRNEYAIDDYYDGFGPEVDERCQECDEYPEDCICCEGDCPKSQGCPRCSYNNDEEDEEEE